MYDSLTKTVIPTQAFLLRRYYSILLSDNKQVGKTALGLLGVPSLMLRPVA